MTKRTFHRLTALWIFCLIWAFMPPEWMFARWLQWGVTVVYWMLASVALASFILIPFNDWIEDRLEDE